MNKGRAGQNVKDQLELLQSQELSYGGPLPSHLALKLDLSSLLFLFAYLLFTVDGFLVRMKVVLSCAEMLSLSASLQPVGMVM